jgi:hypothetical protein
MTEDDISTVIRAFGEAAFRAKASGFDAVQIHAGHGYLLSQFLSPLTNRRTDSWGGSLESPPDTSRDLPANCEGDRRRLPSDDKNRSTRWSAGRIQL